MQFYQSTHIPELLPKNCVAKAIPPDFCIYVDAKGMAYVSDGSFYGTYEQFMVKFNKAAEENKAGE